MHKLIKLIAGLLIMHVTGSLAMQPTDEESFAAKRPTFFDKDDESESSEDKAKKCFTETECRLIMRREENSRLLSHAMRSIDLIQEINRVRHLQGLPALTQEEADMIFGTHIDL